MVGPLNRDDYKRKVADLWDAQGGWNWDHIDVALHHNLRSKLT